MNNERKILVLSGITHFYSHFFMLMFPSLALWIHRDLGLSLPETLEMGFAMYLMMGLAALPMGAIGDRWSERKLLIIMLLGAGAVSMATGMVTGSRSLMFGLAAIGFFCSIYHPVGIGMISKCCSQRGKAMAINGVCGNLGIGAAPFIVGLLAHFVGWRISIAIFGAVSFVIGLVMLTVPINEEPIDGDGKSGGAEYDKRHILYYGLMLLCMLLLGFCYRGSTVVMPAYFEERITVIAKLFQMESTIALSSTRSLGATLLVSGVYLFGIFGQMLGGWLADRIDLRKAYLMFHIASLPMMWAMSFLTEIPLFLVAMLYVFFSLGMQPIENSLVARLTPSNLRGLAYGLKFILVLGLSALWVKAIARIMDGHGTPPVFKIQSGMIVLVIIGVGILCLISRKESFRN